MKTKLSWCFILMGLLFFGELFAQRLCRNNSTGVVRWVSGNCPSGFTNINNSVRSEYLRANSVTTDKIQNAAVTDSKIAGVSASKVDFTGWTVPAGSVITDSLANLAVTNDKLAGGITEDKLAGNISWSKINAASIPAGSIPQSKIDFSGFTVPADSVGTSQIQNSAVTNQKLAGNIDWSKINSSSIPVGAIHHTRINFSGFSVPAGSVGTSQIVDGAVTNAKFSSNAADKLDFSKVNVPNGAITTAMIGENQITNSKLAGNIEWSKIDAASIPDSSISHTKVDFSSWTAPTGSVNSASVVDDSLTADDLANDAVDTAEIKDGAVTNAKINIDTGGSLPYHTFLSTVNLTAATGTGYIPLIGYNLIPQASETGLTASNEAFGCSSGTLRVVLDTAPGATNSRTFELRDGNNTISGSSISISDSNTTGFVNFSSIPTTANLVLHASVSGTPAAARATIYFVCK